MMSLQYRLQLIGIYRFDGKLLKFVLHLLRSFHQVAVDPIQVGSIEPVVID